jgi:class 3 adenylate cyclase/tetratricopeptide (TPR) repeat protein
LTWGYSNSCITEPEGAAVDVGGWLRNLGLERYEAAFRENDVSMDILRHLTAEDLIELGVAAVGHRRRLLVAIAALRDRAVKPIGEGAIMSAGERRQLTVMFCDLVDSTALSEKLDPEELRGVLHAYRDLCGGVITRYDGFVARYVGDGILTYFGWPAAHEEDAERAVRAALEILRTIKRASSTEDLSVRIGIATGPVVIGNAGGVADLSNLAVGSTPNLAARLQGFAAAGQVVIGAATRRLIGNAFELTDLGHRALKGIAEPVQCWRVEHAVEAESRFDAKRGGSALAPLTGRDEELDFLLRLWSQRNDATGRVVLLSGEPGIGKSRILSALRERLEAQGVRALRSQCSPYHVNSAFWPIIDNFERALAFGRDETADSKLDKLEALIVAQYGRPLADVRFIASILSVPCEQRYGALPMTPHKLKDETLRAIVDIAEAAARKQPGVVLFEDVHWADPTSQEVLDLLVDRAKRAPLLMVFTHRPEFQPRWPGQEHVAALSLSKLSRQESAALVGGLTGGKALPAELLEQILTRTDGVPLFIEELTKSILESGELTEAGDHYEYSGVARPVSIPATLRDSLMARLDRFLPVKEIAQIGAAIGREFSYGLIAAVAPMRQEEVDDALARLTASGLAFRRGMPPDAVYTFKHALVQDTAYDSLLKRRRQQLHGEIAGVIEHDFPGTRTSAPELLARHYTEAGVAEAAIPLWQAAGALALKRMALTEAIAHLERGLELIPALPGTAQRDAVELDLHCLLGIAWTALKTWAAPEVWNSLHPALGLAKSLGRHDALVPVMTGLHNNVLGQGRVAEALARAEEMVQVGTATGKSDLLIMGQVNACSCLCFGGRFTEALERADKVLDLYDARAHRHLADLVHHDPRTAALMHSSISTWILGYPDRALRLSDEKDAQARWRGHIFELGWALTMGPHEYDARCGHEDLRRRAEECERLGRDNRLPFLWSALAPLAYGQALIRAGKPAEGMVPLKASLSFWNASGGKVRSPTLKAQLAEAMALTGEVGDALKLIDEQIAQVERPGWEERLYYAEILRLKGWMLLLQGQHEGAERNFLASLDWARRQRAKSWELRTSVGLARLWQSQGKRQAAYDVLAPVFGWFTEGFDSKDLREAEAVLAELG